MTREEELERRLSLWSDLKAHDTTDVEASLLREMTVYGGQQGIWVDKSRTGSLTVNGDGATVAVRHTGRHYPDDLTVDGLTYHYRETSRPAARDRGEIEATKNTSRLGLPLFVILPGERRASRRSVRLGWVEDWDDASQQFLMLFSDERPHYSTAPEPEAPFALIDERPLKTVQAKAREGQQRFRFQVLAQYGCKCAVCSIGHPRLIQAAHLRGKAEKGSDDWRKDCRSAQHITRRSTPISSLFRRRA